MGSSSSPSSGVQIPAISKRILSDLSTTGKVYANISIILFRAYLLIIYSPHRDVRRFELQEHNHDRIVALQTITRY